MKTCPNCNSTFDDALSQCPEDGFTLIDADADHRVGKVFAEHYEIISVLGLGGMSVVYKARHKLMDRIVAIKLLHGRADDLATARFKLEAKAASSLNHPNVVTVYDFGIFDKQAYLVMDCLDGTDLSDIIKKETRISLERAVHIFRQACEGLEHAHRKGIVHRDLKPSNLCLIKTDDDDEFVKIVDFGIAKILTKSGDQPTQLTQTGDIFGSPLYMSPEQCLGQPLDTRSDIYSLGCVMYESLVGKPPQDGDTAFNTMTRHISVEPLSFEKAAPSLKIDPSMEAIVFRCLEKKREDRYQSVSDILADLPVVKSGDKSITLRRVAHPAKVRLEMRFLRVGFWTLLSLVLVVIGYMSVDNGPNHDRGTVLEKTVWNAQTTLAQSCIDARFYSLAQSILSSAEITARKKFSNRGRMLTALELQRDLFMKARLYEDLETVNHKITEENKRVILESYESTLEEVNDLAKSNSELSININKVLSSITLVRVSRVSRALAGYGMDKHAEHLLLTTKAVYLKLLGPDDPCVADTDFLLAEIYLLQQQSSKVRTLLAEAVSIYEKSKGISDKKSITALMKLGQLERDENNFAIAKQELENALHAAQQYMPNDRPLIAKCLRSLADFYEQTGDQKKSDEVFAQADQLSSSKDLTED